MLTISDFPSEIQAIIDPIHPTPAPEGAPFQQQPVCNPDARVTAQLDDAPLEDRLLPWQIANAEKGDLLVTPGGPSGMIGGLLGRLAPAQVFSHMGIFVEDFYQVRHATLLTERLKRFPHLAGTPTAAGTAQAMDILGLKSIEEAPTDGFQESELRFGWPGTLTQTIEQAYMSAAQPSAQSLGYPDEASRTAYLDTFRIFDPVSNQGYFIGALTFQPEQVLVAGSVSPCQPTPADGKWLVVWPLVVKPCQTMETERVRDALHRVAEAAKRVRGHYRLFAYTQARVGLDPKRTGPPMIEPVVPDPACPNLKTGDTLRTTGVVCSTLVWLAVELANREANPAAGKPLIVLDGRPGGRIPATNACTPAFPIDTTADKFTTATPDGLYDYDRAERAAAAAWLYDYLHDCEVIKEIAANTDLQQKLDQLFAGSSSAWTIWKLAKLLLTFTPVQVALILGVSGAVVELLIRLLSDMPDDVAQQVANAFASDDCSISAKDSTAWTDDPGNGVTVSPDNIVRSWSPPTPSDLEIVHGLYGHNVRARLEPPTFEENGPPPSSWKISQGFGGVEGWATFRGVGMAGVRIRVGASRFRSQPSGAVFKTGLPSGRYWVTASFEAPDGLILEPRFVVNRKTGLPFDEAVDPPELKALSKGRAIEIRDDNATTPLIIELEEPSDNRRQVWLEGHEDNVNRYAIGKDWWDHPRFARGPFLLGDAYPDRPEFEQLRRRARWQDSDVTFQIDDWGQSQVKLVFEIAGDADVEVPASVRYKTIKVTCRARLKQIEDDGWQHEETFYVPPKAHNSDPGMTKVIDLVRSEMAWPVRSHIELTIHNDRR